MANGSTAQGTTDGKDLELLDKLAKARVELRHQHVLGGGERHVRNERERGFRWQLGRRGRRRRLGELHLVSLDAQHLGLAVAPFDGQRLDHQIQGSQVDAV